MDLSRLFDISGKVAVVTGAGSGIGRAISLAYAGLGAKVGLLDFSNEALDRVASEIKSAGLTCHPIRADVTQVEDVRRAIRELHREFGQIDILVNCAGIAIVGNLEDFTEEQWDKVIDTNVKGSFLCAQEAAKIMKVQGEGKIINIASIAGERAWPGRVLYVTSKGGVVQLTKGLAVDLAPFKINVNAIAPAFVETPATHKTLANPEFRAWVLSRTPLGQVLNPEDMIGAAVFLASDASAMVTGHILHVDGGWTAH